MTVRLLRAVIPLLLISTVATAAEPRPEAMVLGRSDLPKGYGLGDDTACGELGVEGFPPRLTQIILAHRPHACFIQLENLRNGRYIESDALVFASTQGASEMYADRRELLEHEMGITKAAVRAQRGIGEEARIYVTSDALALGVTRPGAVMFWRRGTVVGGLLVAGPSRRTCKRVALRLARMQDERMARVLG
jgi:hypothetical protein